MNDKSALRKKLFDALVTIFVKEEKEEAELRKDFLSKKITYDELCTKRKRLHDDDLKHLKEECAKYDDEIQNSITLGEVFDEAHKQTQEIEDSYPIIGYLD